MLQQSAALVISQMVRIFLRGFLDASLRLSGIKPRDMQPCRELGGGKGFKEAWSEESPLTAVPGPDTTCAPGSVMGSFGVAANGKKNALQLQSRCYLLRGEVR